ncbi:MAG: RHS repeat-associated core domain-containing [Bacteroidetes bacterium]|nr:MAG: RHS repeat-associated core domain-containing [Bacteroidota bacterium]
MGAQRLASRPVSGGSGGWKDVSSAELTALKQRQQDDLKAMLAHYDFDEIHYSTAFEVEEDSLKTMTLYYFHPDHLGTSTLLTDNLGNPYQFFLNLPFGETMAEQKATDTYTNPYLFNGKELDEETGLYYYGARYYNPRYSLWLGVDAMVEKYAGITPYNYCLNMPTRIIDPDGNDWFENELTGAIYYNNNLGKKDIGKGALAGEGWKHLGNNEMFSNGQPYSQSCDVSLVSKNGGSISFDKSSKTYNMELSLNGDKGEKFMNQQGYEKLPTQYVEYSLTKKDKYPMGPNRFIEITTGNATQINEKYGYFEKGSVGYSKSMFAMIGEFNLILGTERIDRKAVTYFSDSWAKGFDFFYNITAGITGSHNYVNKTVHESWSAYPESNPLINKFRNNRTQ